MVDQQKYINTYIDKSIGMIHENVSTILQLKTQLEIANNLLFEKDELISSLQSDSDQLSAVRQSAETWEQSYHSMKNKIDHMDTLIAQYNETKNLLIEKTKEVELLNEKIRKIQLKNEKVLIPKKVINTKKIESKVESEPDDF